ncbi:hypothetical protein JW710_01770 [Candidatus Dojkabacteria bacterium]|nr:hypothetical protein [Candidatus Dojkabacteria bacterium]
MSADFRGKEDVPSGEDYAYLPVGTFERLLESERPHIFAVEDTLNPDTSVSFALSDGLCEHVCQEIIYDCSRPEGALGREQRQVVTCSPLVVRRYAGRDSIEEYLIGAPYFSPFLLRRAGEEDFQSWTVTEKIERPKMRALSEKLIQMRSSTILACQGFMEELVVMPDSCIVQVPRPVGPPVDVLMEDFYVDYIPVGVLYNFEREKAPIVPVVLIITNGLVTSVEFLSGSCTSTSACLPVLLGKMMRDERVDSWSRIIARACLDNHLYLQRIEAERMDKARYAVMRRVYLESIGVSI